MYNYSIIVLHFILIMLLSPQEMDAWYKNKFEDITSKTTHHVDRVRGIREGIAGAKKDVSLRFTHLNPIKHYY